MDWTLVTNALGLSWNSSLPYVVLILLGAGIAGIFQVATQIQDEAIGFAGRFFALIFAIYIFGSQTSTTIIEFTQRVWGGVEFFR